MTNLSDFRIWMLEPNWNPNICNSSAPIFVNVQLNDQNVGDLGISTITTFIQAILLTSINQSTEGQLCEWWTSTWNAYPDNTTTFIESIYNNVCIDQICSIVGWGGNLDTAGIGMIVVYITLLVLVFVYTLAITTFAHNRIDSSTTVNNDQQAVSAPSPNFLSKFRDPFQGTLIDLFDACLNFIISAEISTLAFHSSAATRYEMVIAELLCLFSSTASVVLSTFQRDIGRFKTTRFSFFLISCILPIAVWIVYGRMPKKGMQDLVKEEGTEDFGKDFVMMCVDSRMHYVTESEMRDALLMTGWAIMICSQLIIGMKQFNYFRRIVPYFGCFAMIWCIVEIQNLRRSMKDTAGSNYNENSWGFGKIYALSTWFPILTSFGFFFIFRDKALAAVYPRARRQFKNLWCPANVTSKSASALAVRIMHQPYRKQVQQPKGENYSQKPAK